jgi:hypothetical protein
LGSAAPGEDICVHRREWSCLASLPTVSLEAKERCSFQRISYYTFHAAMSIPIINIDIFYFNTATYTFSRNDRLLSYCKSLFEIAECRLLSTSILSIRKRPFDTPRSNKHLIAASSHFNLPELINPRQHYVYSRYPSVDGSAKSVSDLVHINTRDILSVMARRQDRRLARSDEGA